MNRTTWLQLERWYNNLHIIQQWLVKIGLVVFCLIFIAIVTHEPSERKRVTKIVLNCNHCGTDPERTITYNEYMNQKEHAEKTRFWQEKQHIQQDIWDEHGRERWCRNHLSDYNCKKDGN